MGLGTGSTLFSLDGVIGAGPVDEGLPPEAVAATEGLRCTDGFLAVAPVVVTLAKEALR